MSEEKRSAWTPVSRDEHERQIRSLLAALNELGADTGTALDLGCGDGRIAHPIADTGWRVIAVDKDAEALTRCAGANIETRQCDMFDASLVESLQGETIAAGWCMGRTWLHAHDPSKAVELMRRLAALIAPGGWFAIDAFCEQLWSEIAEGYWQTGISEQGDMQLIWATGDNVLTIRKGEAVDPDDWTIKPEDELLRIWSMGELRLLAQASGWGAPRIDIGGSLLFFDKLQ